jgi:hypothetical protein
MEKKGKTFPAPHAGNVLIFQFLFLSVELLGFYSEKHFLCLYLQGLSPGSFKISGLVVTSLIHLELIFL